MRPSTISALALTTSLLGCGSLLGFEDYDFEPAKPTQAGGASGHGGLPDLAGGMSAGGSGLAGNGASGSGATAGTATGGTSAAGNGGAGGTQGIGGSPPGAGGLGGTSAGASGATGTAGTPTGTGGTTGGAGGGVVDPCATVTCGQHASCQAGTCSCDAGFIDNAGTCVAIDVSCQSVTCPIFGHCDAGLCACDGGAVPRGAGCWPTTPTAPDEHTKDQICAVWQSGHTVTDPSPWTAGGGGDCDPGSLSEKGIADTLNRLAMFRWMVGQVPTDHDPQLDAIDQACATVASWNPPGTVPNPHSPPTTAKCYSAEGAQGAGMSNIAWGSGHPAQAIDQFVEDNGNETTFGHRRWCLHPPLGPVGIGYFAGGGQYGNAECLAVFNASTPTPPVPRYTIPPAGFTPTQVARYAWTYHSSAGVGSSPTMTVHRASDGATLAMTTQQLSQGFGDDTVAFFRSGWDPTAGETYQVTIDGLPEGSYSYEVKPIDCP
jgi:hypothetical protein